MTRLEEIDNANRGQDVYKLTRIWLDERGLEQQSVSGLLTCTMRHIDTLEDKNAAQRQAIEDLRKQLSESVPRSRYDACNQDWLDAKAKLKQVQQAASKEIKQLEGRVQALEGALSEALLGFERCMRVAGCGEEFIQIKINKIKRQAALAATGEERKAKP